LVKDANTTTQSISTLVDVAGNLVPVHAPAAIAGGIATPVGPRLLSQSSMPPAQLQSTAAGPW
jgi:hypothetical protein